MKNIPILALLLLIFPASAIAQSPDNTETTIQLNQPYVSKDLGSVTFPFMWNITEAKNRLVATENSEIDPGVITLDTFKYPQDLKADAVATNILQSVAQTLSAELPTNSIQQQSLCPETPGAKKCKNPIQQFSASISGSENGIPRSCALELYLSQAAHTVIALSFCAPEDKLYTPSKEQTLKDVFLKME